MQRNLRLNLNERDFFTSGFNEIDTIAISNSESLRTERFRWSPTTIDLP